MKVVFSLVLYKHSYKEIYSLLNDIDNFYNFALPQKIFTELKIYDNSPKRKYSLEKYLKKNYINYLLNTNNIGFGKAHNMNLLQKKEISKDTVFIIVNPDINFKYEELFDYLRLFILSNYVCVAPLILNENGKIQYSAKKNPTLLSLILGRFKIFKKFYILDNYYKNHINYYINYQKEKIKSSYLSGCFLIVRAQCFYKVNGFDKRYFLHLEDADFTRMCSNYGEVIHDPSLKIIHRWARGSHKSFRQMFCLCISLIKYFWKWGFEVF